jgi:PH-interacting protein
MLSCRNEKQFGADRSQDLDGVRNKDHAHPDGALISSSSFESSLPGDHQPKANASVAPLEINEVVGTNHSNEPKEDAPPKSTKLIIRTKKRIVMDPKTPSKLKFITSVEDQSSARGVLKPESQMHMDPNLVLRVPEQGEATGRSSSLRLRNSYSDIRMSDASYGGERFRKAKTDSDGFDSGIEENAAVNDHDLETDVPEPSTDAIRRTRSMKMKATSREPNAVNRNFKVRRGHGSEGTSRNAENPSLELSEQLLQGSRSTRYQHGGYNDYEPSSSTRRKSNYSVRKLSWLMLSEHEEGYRYIPQLGDEVVYLRQVVPDYS